MWLSVRVSKNTVTILKRSNRHAMATGKLKGFAKKHWEDDVPDTVALMVIHENHLTTLFPDATIVE